MGAELRRSRKCPILGPGESEFHNICGPSMLSYINEYIYIYILYILYHIILYYIILYITVYIYIVVESHELK